MANAKSKSRKGGASSHLRPCKCAYCDKHNERTDLNPSNSNIRPALSHKNSIWKDPAVPNLVTLDRQIRKDYFKAQGRHMPHRGPSKASPLKESVTIMPSGSMETDEVQRRIVNRIQNEFHIRCVRMYNHRDEYCVETGTFNWHSHEVWDMYDHDRHRMVALTRADCRKWQDIVAEETGMPRGNPAYETHRRWLSATEVKVQAQQERLMELKEEHEGIANEIAQEFSLKEDLERHNNWLYNEKKQLSALNKELNEAAEKKKYLVKIALEIEKSIRTELQLIVDKYRCGYKVTEYGITFRTKELISPCGERSLREFTYYNVTMLTPEGKRIQETIEENDYYKSSDAAIRNISKFFFGLPTYKKKMVSKVKKTVLGVKL